MITAGMGGVLPEQPDPTIFQRVLDVGCGTGGWLIEAAKTYPTMSLLGGRCEWQDDRVCTCPGRSPAGQ